MERAFRDGICDECDTLTYIILCTLRFQCQVMLMSRSHHISTSAFDASTKLRQDQTTSVFVLSLWRACIATKTYAGWLFGASWTIEWLCIDVFAMECTINLNERPNHGNVDWIQPLKHSRCLCGCSALFSIADTRSVCDYSHTDLRIHANIRSMHMQTPKVSRNITSSR